MDQKVCPDLLEGFAYIDPPINLPISSTWVGQMTQAQYGV